MSRIVTARGGTGAGCTTPYVSLSDFHARARVSRPVLERLVLAGAFDDLYRIASGEHEVRPRGRLTRRDLLLQVAELDRHARMLDRTSRGPWPGGAAGLGAGATRRRPRRTPRRAPAPTRPSGRRPSRRRPGRSARPTRSS